MEDQHKIKLNWIDELPKTEYGMASSRCILNQDSKFLIALNTIDHGFDKDDFSAEVAVSQIKKGYSSMKTAKLVSEGMLLDIVAKCADALGYELKRKE